MKLQMFYIRLLLPLLLLDQIWLCKMIQVNPNSSLSNSELGTARRRSPTSYTIPMETFMIDKYYIELGIGTPPQTFTFLVDTGSEVLWVPIKGCLNGSWPSDTRFNPTLSSTHGSSQGRFMLSYGKGKLTGLITTDTVWVRQTCVPEFRFGLGCIMLEPLNLLGGYTGVLGLSRGITTTGFDGTFADAMSRHHSLEFHGFSIWFCPNSDSYRQKGKLIFGGTCEECYMGHIVYVPLEDYRAKWAITVERIMVGESVIFKGKTIAVMDTGTNRIKGPRPLVDMILQMFVGVMHHNAGTILVNCSTIHTYPRVTFVVNGHPFILDWTEYIMKRGKRNQYPEYCISAFNYNIRGETVWILGLQFHQAFYTIYDYGRNRIGFARSQCA